MYIYTVDLPISLRPIRAEKTFLPFTTYISVIQGKESGATSISFTQEVLTFSSVESWRQQLQIELLSLLLARYNL
jgi:hypothetical protein